MSRGSITRLSVGPRHARSLASSIASTLLLACAGLVGASACVSSSAPPPPAAGPVTDGGPSGDAGTDPDAEPFDAGGGGDAGEHADSGPPGGVDAGVDAGPRHFCLDQPPSPKNTEFYCADFDIPNPASVFDSIEAEGGGTFDVTDALFKSPPRSLLPKHAMGVWKTPKSGDSVSKIVVEFQVNVASLPGVIGTTSTESYLRLDAGLVRVYFNYAYKNTIDGGNIAYTGHYLAVQDDRGAASFAVTKIPTPMKTSVWTRVSLVWTTTSFEVFYDGTSVASSNAAALTTTDVSLRVGRQSAQGAVSILSGLDNVTVSVARQP